MSETIISNIKITANQATLSDTQKIQFKQVTMEGLKGKFSKTLQNDTPGEIVINFNIHYRDSNMETDT